MSMIQPGKIDYNNEVLSCRIHDILLDLIRSKAAEENFCLVIDGSKVVTEAPEKVRRVSAQLLGKELNVRILAATFDSLTHVRSVLIFGGYVVPSFLVLTYVRVLHLESREMEHLDLTGMCGLSLLRYLKIVLGFSPVLKLPNQIGELQQLETIDVKDAEDIPPGIVGLARLSHLIIGFGAVFPEGIGRLKSLRTLKHFDLGANSVDCIKGLGELTNLRDLNICWRIPCEPVDVDMHMDALRSSIGSLSGSLRSLVIAERCNVKLPPLYGWSSTTSAPVRNLRKLDLISCYFERVPQWIAELRELYSLRMSVREVADGFSIVAELPCLAYFYLDCSGEEQETTDMSGFRALKHLDLDCRNLSLTFQAGALARLEKLELYIAGHFLPVGIGHLPAGIEHLSAGTLREVRLKVLDIEQHRPFVRDLFTRAFEPHHPCAIITIHFEYSFSPHGWQPYLHGATSSNVHTR